MKRTPLALIGAVALFPAAAHADNDAFSFEGQYTAPDCGEPFAFPVGPLTRTIDVVASTDVAANDILLKLLKGGTLLAQQDTLTSPEGIHYATGSELETGEYTVLVCPFNGQAVVSPSDYVGVVALSELALPALTPPGSQTNPVTLYPVPRYQGWTAKFTSPAVVDPQRTEGEPLVKVDRDGQLWESGPWGFSTNMSFIHRSTSGGQDFHLVSAIGSRPDEPPGGGDSDVALDDQGNVYFTDLEGPLTQLGVSVSNDNGHNWRKNPAAVQQSAVDRQWLAVDNGVSAGAHDNTVFLTFHTAAGGTFIYSSPGSQGPNDPTGGLLFQNSGSLPGPLQALAGDAVCAQLRFDPVLRNLYYACNEGDHIRVTVGKLAPGQRTGIEYANYNGPRTPGGELMSLFPALATDEAGHVYVAWIDAVNFNLYYAFSSDEGRSWSAPVRVNNGTAATNEFEWAQAGKRGQLALAWYATDRVASGGSDAMPSALDNLGEATQYPWYGYAALISEADTRRPVVKQARFTSKPMHYGNICNSGIGCTLDPSADRTMADYFGFDVGPDGAMHVVFNDTTNEFDGAGLFYTRQYSGPGLLDKGVFKGAVAANPALDAAGDANWPHYSPTGPGPSLPHLDLTSVQVSNPNPTTLRVKMQVASLNQLTPPPGKPAAVWLTRFQALAPRPGGPENVYRIFYLGMESKAGLPPGFFAGTASCQGTTPSNCKLFQYRGEKPATGSISGNTVTIDVGVNTGFGVPLLGNTLHSVTAFSFGRSNNLDDLYADVDATPPFDYVMGSSKAQ
jgi:hypothetical protein